MSSSEHHQRIKDMEIARDLVVAYVGARGSATIEIRLYETV